MKVVRSARILLLACSVGLFSGGIARADEVTDSINQGLEQYKKGSLAEAMTSLNFASQKISQLKADTLKGLIPQPLAGWQAEKVDAQAAGAALFGGGITAEGRYRKGEQGDVSVKIITDSPLIQSMLMLISNPMFATSNGGKLEKINNQTAIVKYDADGKRGDINIVVANKTLVTIEGSEIGQEDLLAYAKAVDYTKIAALP